MPDSSHVVVVEESKIWISMLTDQCKKRGLKVSFTDSTCDALQIVAETHPLAVVAGLEQRDYSAVSLVAALKSTPSWCSLPIAVLTSSDESEKLFGPYPPDTIIPRSDQSIPKLEDFLESLVKRDSSPLQRLKPEVLLVEDTASLQRLVGKFLHVGGYRATVADHGLHALEILDGAKFDLILLDIEMPEMDGRETIQHIRSRGLPVPVIAFTATDSPEFQEEAERLGFDAVCNKPVRPEDLLKLCDECISVTSKR